MPLLKRARIEVYLPVRGNEAYSRLRGALESEFLSTFGGCTVITDISGLYLDSAGKRDSDRLELVYADTPFDFDRHIDDISTYTDELRVVLEQATSEEKILIVLQTIFHSGR